MIDRVFIAVTAAMMTWPCLAASSIQSSKNDYFSDDLFMAIGVNPTTHVVTGYFSALRTAPGRTDACKFVFRGEATPDGKVRLSIKDAIVGNSTDTEQRPTELAVLTAASDTLHLTLPKSLAPGDCDWLLGWIGAPDIVEEANNFNLSVRATPGQDWIGVAAIRSKRAFFHTAPDDATVRKAFVVAGNVVYVLEEKAGWYRVKFTHAARETTGWIKAADTVQFP